MRVFVAGASGAIGSRLVPQLVERGHEVVGSSRSPGKSDRLAALGAEPIVLDLLDPDAVRKAVTAARPDAIVHQATALRDLSDLKNSDKSFAETNRLRTEGTDALLAAGTRGRRQPLPRAELHELAVCPRGRPGQDRRGPARSRARPDDAQDPGRDSAPRAGGRRCGGIALRYGGFYGSPGDAQLELVRKRRFPIVGDGGGIWSFVHLDDAASATVLALEDGAPGIYNVVDDEPAPVSDWLPALADAIGAKPPRHVPRWLARIVAGEAGVALMTEIRGASNAKAKRELGWTLRYPSWRQGFPAAYSPGGA